jgi:hypothetical protein
VCCVWLIGIIVAQINSRTGVPFTRGKSGNPKGRPKGSRDSRALLFDELVPHGGALIAKAVAMAMEGDPVMIKLCLDKLVGNARPREHTAQVSGLVGSLSARGERVLEVMAAGEISVSEGSALLGAIATQAKLVEIDDLTKRIEALEHSVS